MTRLPGRFHRSPFALTQLVACSLLSACAMQPGSDLSGVGEGQGDALGSDHGDPPEAEEEDDDEDSTDPELDCDESTPTVLYLSPDDSNSMSSPAQVRQRVLFDQSDYLSDIGIRTWEFMNYYGFDYPAAAPGTLAVDVALEAAAEDNDGDPRYRMQIGVSSEHVLPTERAPMNVTLVLDTSGSMGGEPLSLLKASCRAIAGSLRAGDRVSMVEWDTANNVVLANHVVEGPNDARLRAAIDALAADGGTDLHGGLVEGYRLASQVWDAQRINRLVLISDGGANVGVTDEELIGHHAALAGSDGIYLVGVGVGGGSYNDLLMDTVTDAGKGAAVYVGSEADAVRSFGDEFISTMAVAARDVQVELSLPPGFEVVRFSGEELGEDPHEVEPQHLAPNDSMVFHQEIETCAPELVSPETPITVRATYKDVRTFEAKEVTKTITFAQALDGNLGRLRKGAAVFAFAEGLIDYKQDGFSGLDRAYAEVVAALEWLPDDGDLLEIRGMIEQLRG